MLVGPVLAVSDLTTARAFYEDKLGLEGESTPGGWVVRGDGDTVAYLLPGIAEAGSAGWPVASFRVDEVGAKVRELTQLGVEFLGEEDLPFELDADGISRDTPGIEVAWFKDPDGSVLTLFGDATE